MSRAAYVPGVESALKREPPRRGRRRAIRRSVGVLAAGAAAASLALVAGIVWWSGATLAGDATALARVDVQPLGGSLVSARAFGPVGAPISPRDAIRLTFSQPIEKALGSARPRFSSAAPGSWRATDSHTLLFTPRGFGFPLASALRVELPRVLSVSTGDSAPTAIRTIQWKVAGAQFIRLQQLLADAGYLPLVWRAAGGPSVARQPLAEIDAAVTPPAGRFNWRYANTPRELQRLWRAGQPNQITRGAVMMFEHDHGLTVDGLAGARVWRALLTDAVAGKKRTDGYSYVYVHRNLPQLLTLWHNGRTVLTSPGNTGVPAAPTQLGTFPVFEHIPIGTMSGTNPDGSHYHDPGIRWISYFNGGDALHSFTRASFGTPQSLGCVELPLATAAKVWPYTPIGTLVTIEN